jgi:hypothetical protein
MDCTTKKESASEAWVAGAGRRGTRGRINGGCCAVAGVEVEFIVSVVKEEEEVVSEAVLALFVWFLG